MGAGDDLVAPIRATAKIGMALYLASTKTFFTFRPLATPAVVREQSRIPPIVKTL